MAHVHVVIYGSMFQRLVHVPLTAQILATSPGYARDVVAVSPNPSRTAKPVSAGPFFPLDELQDDGNSHSAVHPSPHNQLAMDQNYILGPQVGSEATLPLNPSPHPPYAGPSSTQQSVPRVPRPVPLVSIHQRWCQYCQIVKPDRTHHCRHCGTCILQFDRECPVSSAG